MRAGGMQKWEQTETADTLNIYDISEMRTPVLIVSFAWKETGPALPTVGGGIAWGK